MSVAVVAIVWEVLLAGVPALGAPGEGGKRVGPGFKGSFELGLAGLYDFDTDDDTVGYVDLSIAYYVVERIGLGLDLVNGTTATGQRDTTGLFGEYNLTNDSDFTPFAGMAGHHAEAPVASDGVDARLLTLFGGVKVGLSRSVGLGVTVKAQYATDPVLGPPGARKRRNRELDLSLRFYF